MYLVQKFADADELQ